MIEDLTAPLELVWQFEPPPKNRAEGGGGRHAADSADQGHGGDRRRPSFIGSEESRFFCIDLNDGSLIWEFAAEAPSPRRPRWWVNGFSSATTRIPVRGEMSRPGSRTGASRRRTRSKAG